MKILFQTLLSVFFLTSSHCIFAQQVFINEIHIENLGSDINEAVEIFGPANTPLRDWSIAFYDGLTGQVYLTHTFTTTDIIPDMGINNGQASGVIVVNFASEEIDNGSVAGAGVALINDQGEMQQFISYKGAVVAAGGFASGSTSIDIGVAENSDSPSTGSLRMGLTGWIEEITSSIGGWNPEQPNIPTEGGAAVTCDDECRHWVGEFNTNGNIYRSGKVGIGSSTAPKRLLTLSDNTNPIMLFERVGGGWDAEISVTGGGDMVFKGGNDFNQGLGENFKITGGGDIYVEKGIFLKKNITGASESGAFSIYGNQNSTSGPYINMFGPSHPSEANRLSFFAGAGGDIKFYNRTASGGWQHNMVITSEGKVGIGTTNIPSAYRMAIKGGIVTDEVKVEICNSGGWCDYVFEEDYKLYSLEEVKGFIDANGHLPNIPSSAELVAQGGFELKDMTTRQQEKIEELFLYIIKMDEKMTALKEELDALKKK